MKKVKYEGKPCTTGYQTGCRNVVVVAVAVVMLFYSEAVKDIASEVLWQTSVCNVGFTCIVVIRYEFL